MPTEKHRSLLPGHWVRSAAVFVVAAAMMVGSALGDDATVVRDDKSTPPGVSVPDSPGASERMDKAHEKELQKQWKTAAEFYQEAIAKYPGRVVPVLRDPERGIYQYSGIAMLAQERISKWPAEGLTIYRNTYGQTAADLLAAAPHGNCAALEAVFWNYFPTDAGKSAGIRLIDASLERGDFQSALWFGNRLLDLHPALAADRGAVLYRTAIAAYRGGDVKQAQVLLNQLKQKNPADVGSIGGKDVSLVDSLTAMLASPPPSPTTRPSDADTYPSFGGFGGRGDISSSPARPGASLTTITLAKPEFAGLQGPQRQMLLQNDKAATDNNLAMGIMPVVDAGSLFFQDGRCVYAVDADTGAPLPGWMETYSGDRGGRYKLNVAGRVRNEPLTLTVTPTAVLAVMGQPDRLSSPMAFPNGFMMQGQMAASPSTVRLVCLDRETGRELWAKTPAELPEPAAAVRTGSYTGTPLLLPASLTGAGEDQVLALARGGSENQFDDCYAVCLSLKTGQYKWSTYLGSSTRTYDLDGTVDPSQASLADGRVFVMTNLGNVAALDPADGRIIWLNSYARDSVMNPEQMFLNARRGFNNGIQQQNLSTTAAWAHNPVFVSDGCVFVLPRDAKQLFVYDAGSGVLKNQIPMSAYDNAEVMLGVRDGCVCLTTKKQLLVVDWKKYQDGDQKIATLWHEDLFGADDGDVCGRGFMTTESIFIPTKYRLRQVAWKSRRIVADYPSNGQFSGDQGPGNMLVTAHDVIVAGQSHVDVYTDLDLVRRRFESAIAAAPTDPDPWLGYAEALFAGGDLTNATARVDEAIDLAGGLNSMRPGKDRERIFNTMIEFAGRAGKNKGKGDDQDNLAWENKFFDRAAAAAETPVQNARYRLARAAFDHAHADYTGEVQLCQEILSDDAMRNAMAAEEQSAGAEAEAAIGIAMTMNRSIYAPIEEKAADAYKAAREANDPEQLLAVATVYPNSRAAVDARQDAVHRFEAANQPDKAIGVLRTMYAGAQGADKADLLLSITNDFLAMPDGLGPALDRLCRASRLVSPSMKLSQKLRLPDGTTLSNTTYADAITRLRQIQADQDNARLPDFHLAAPEAKVINPFMHGPPAKIENVLALVHPLHDFNRVDQILTWSPAGLSIYPVGATVPLATVSQVDKAPIAAAWTGDHWLVWTSSDVYQIDAEGKLAWDFPLAHLPTLVVSAGTDSLIDYVAENGGDDPLVGGPNVQVFNVNGQIIRVRQNGNARVMVRMPNVVMPAPAPPVHVGDEQITSVLPGGDRVLVATTNGRILALDFHGGQIIWQTRPTDHAVDQLLANPHFTVVRMDDPTGSQIAVYDTPTGRSIGRMRFGADGTPQQLVNVALSEEATLAVTLYNQVLVKDLYEPWKSPLQQLVAQANRDIAPFVGLNQPDQLLIHGGRLACLYDGGGYARGYDLSHGGDPTNPQATGELAEHAGTNSSPVSMRMIGPRLFIQTPREIVQYNLQDSSDVYECNIGQRGFIPRVHDVLLGQDHVISINDPVDRGPLGQPYVVLGAFRRVHQQGQTREWGEPEYDPQVKSSAGIIDWIGTQGGVCYLTRDNTLRLLRGARP